MKREIYKAVINKKQMALAFALLASAAFSQTTYTFNFTGSVQTISLPAGNYSIECWGANGGDATNAAAPMLGGVGGYASGVFSNPSAQVFNVYVGGKGGNTSAANTGGGGGGMSDVAPASNTLQLIIVGGGGGGATSGGASEASTGGDGGGLVGGTANDGTGVSTGTAASGGSQTAGGVALAGSYGAGSPGGFGYGGGAANGGTAGVIHSAGGAGGNGGIGGWNGGGGGCTLTGGNDHAAGGGSGYYGGGGGRGDGGAGGGGSSYIGGLTTGTTIMFGQTGFVPNPGLSGNGLVLIKELCSISLSVTGLNVNNAICAGSTVTITTDAVSNYSWTTGSTSNSVVVTPTSTTVYGLTATSVSNCIASSQVSVVVDANPLLNISNNTPVVCLGNSAQISVSGADTYSWNTGSTASNLTVAPVQNTTYSVVGTFTASNCSSTETVQVDVISLSVNITGSNTICKGGTATLTANAPGATSYSWSTGLPGQTILASPPSHTIYVALAQVSTLNIICTAISSVQVIVQPTPNLIVLPAGTSMCVKESLLITAGGANSYAWSFGTQSSSASSITLTPTTNANILVNVTGTGTNGCSSTNSLAIVVNNCSSINENNLENLLQVYPNPSQGDVTISFGSDAELQLYSQTGQLLRSISFNESNGYKANLNNLSNGIYYLSGKHGDGQINKKIVVIN